MGKSKDSKILQGVRLDLKALLPGDDISRSIMVKRARTLSSTGSGGAEKHAGLTSYIKFKTSNGEYYGIPYTDIIDIKEAHNIATVPNVPGYVSGIQYWNGKIIPIIHLMKYFGFAVSESNTSHYLATSSNGDSIIGFLFDDVIGVDAYSVDNLDSNLSTSSRIKDEYIIGIDKGVIAILGIKKIIADISTEFDHAKGKYHEKE